MEMKFGGFRYNRLNNLGDQIQSIATENFLPELNRRFTRDTLSKVSSKSKY